MPSENPVRRWADIVAAIEEIRQFTAGLTLDDYIADPLRRRGVERCFQIITEAAVKLGGRAEEAAPGLPWHAVRAFGNRLRHEYDRVHDDMVWEMIETDLAVLLEVAEREMEKRRPSV